MSLPTFALLLIFSLGVCHCQDCRIDTLIKSLNLNDLEPSARPVNDWRNTSVVTVDLILYSVVKLDTASQTLITLIWFSMTWTNEFIKWNPDNNCSISSININGDNLWKPDLYIYEQTEAEDKSPVIPYFTVSSDGNITNSKPLRISSFCHLDIYRFPFDVQKCDISFGSYVHSDKEIKMIPNYDSAIVYSKSKEFYKNTGEWTLEDIQVEESSVKTDTIYSVVKYTITLKRQPSIYVITFVIPAWFMIILDLVSFFINMGAGERLGFKITIVLGFSVLLLILSNVLPTSTVSPMLGIFCLICISTMVISIMVCVAISHMLMLAESQPNVPPWMKICFLTVLAKILCFRSFEKYGVDMGEPKSKMETCSNDRTVQINMQMTRNTQSPSDNALEVRLQKKLLFQLSKIREDLIDLRKNRGVKTEWHAVALVMDRLAFIIYLLIVIALFITLLCVWSHH